MNEYGRRRAHFGFCFLVRSFLPLILTFSAASSQGAQRELDKSTEVLIDQVVGKVIAQGRSAGIAVGVMYDGEMILAKGYGMANLEDGTVVSPETVFRVGSVTKQFTATSIMLLVEQGKLSVSDKLSTFFPEFPRGDVVTIQQLLNHTSGVHSYTGPDYFHSLGRLDRTTTEFVNYIEQQKPLYDFDPGTKWS